jgi:hypothetical protein
MPCVRPRHKALVALADPMKSKEIAVWLQGQLQAPNLGWLGINRHRGNLDPIGIQNRNAPRRIDCWLVERDAYRENPRLLDCSRVIFAIRPGRVHEPMTVFDIEKIMWH